MMRRLALLCVLSTGCLLSVNDTSLGKQDGGDSGTGTYTATSSKLPLVYWLVDQSGSLNFPLQAGSPNCPPSCGEPSTPCPANCPTRIAATRGVVGAVLESTRHQARQGMVFYPSKQDSCGGPSTSEVSSAPSTTDAAQLEAGALSLKAQLQARAISGGTPTAAAVTYLGTLPDIENDPDQAVLVILVTDGLPNCNSANANTCVDEAACQCTLGSCSGTFCALGCLDEDATVQAITSLRNRGHIKVLVAGVGDDFSAPDEKKVLNDIAAAGGVPRFCPAGDDSRCPGACDSMSGVCKTAYEPVLSLDSAALDARVNELLREMGPCRFRLSPATADRSALEVRLAGVTKQEWYLDRAGIVVLTGALCTAAQANPSALEFRVP